MLVNALSCLALQWITLRLGKTVAGSNPTKLDFTPCNVGMVILNVTLVMATKYMITEQGKISSDKMK